MPRSIGHGRLTEKERQEADRTPGEREEMPGDVFLEPASRKYPVKEKRDGKWAYSPRLLLAAAREARMHGHAELAARADSIRRRLDSGADDEALLVFDRESARSYDEDRRLHVALTPITKATVNEYWGAEIPGAERLGLDPKKKYRLLRDPEELKKAAPTANNIPLMIKHVRQHADDPQKDKIVGSLGTDATFEAPYIKNSLVAWDRDGIDGIEDQSRRELSASYRYDADMTPGTFEGQPYDGVMRNIRFNHVALVKDGRAGSDVLVEDELPEDMNEGAHPMHVSRKRLLVTGALSAYLTPMLAKDAKLPSLDAALAGVTAKNFKTAKPRIVAKAIELVTPVLAKDADLKGVHDFIDSLDEMGAGEPDEMETMDRRGRARDADPEGETEEERKRREEEEARARDRRPAKDADGELAKVFQFLDGKIDGELMDGLKKLMEGGGDDRRARDNETPEEMERRHAADRAAMDKRMGRDKRARDAEPESAEEKAKREKEERERREKERADDKRANDSAIKDAIAAERQRGIDLREAENAVRPYVGTIEFAMDSAEQVYRYALDSLSVKHTGVHPTALRAVLDAQPKPGARSGEVRLANDSATVKKFADMFPNAAKVRLVA